MKKTIRLIVCLLCVLALSVPAFAEPIQSRAVIGADLRPEQITAVYNVFGVSRGQVIELKVTNAEERRYLNGIVDSSLIGTRSISCVYVELLPSGSGMSVVTNNISWCTGQMYVSALATAGITDARIVVASPVEVSGTAALTGVYKAYEDMTGMKLADASKLLGARELAVTGSLAGAIGNEDSLAIVNELKLMLDKTREMSDEEIRDTVLSIAARYNVKLTETQVQQLLSLCRALEALDPAELKERAGQVQDTIRQVSEAGSKIMNFLRSAKSFFASISGLFDSLNHFFTQFS